MAVNGDPLFRRAAKLVGAPEWLDDPRFASDKARGDNGAIISARLQEWCAARTSADAIIAFENARVPAGPVYRMRETLDDPHVKAGDFFTEIDFPGVGRRARGLDARQAARHTRRGASAAAETWRAQ